MSEDELVTFLVGLGLIPQVARWYAWRILANAVPA